ncbi:hypothetical protein [Micromonospora sp. NPDC048830]|uniref:hypothetical protein n=1 Tax=Micromonospora sp. NPDC048830 TaxID=3364257 RepID=UPI0037186936
MKGPALSTPIRPATPSDVASVTQLLINALANDPVAEWLVPDPAERTSVLWRMLALDVDHTVETGRVDLAVNMSAVAAWRRHDPDVQRWVPTVHHLKAFAGRSSPRFAALQVAVDSYRSSAPHYWLSWFAVHPDVRGRGMLREMLRRYHEVVDEAEYPSYAVVTTEAARDMLQRHGYYPALPLHLPSGPRLWPLARNGRPTRGASAS